VIEQREWMAERFEEHREHLRQVAYRMLGSLSDADDAVQESWLRLSRADTGDVENMRAWLTTVVARVCLNVLRARSTHREELIDVQEFDRIITQEAADAEQETVLADSVGLALLVVLERLSPAERLAFVLHDMFDLPFDEIAQVVGRSPEAARQLASRARRRVRGEPTVTSADLTRHREVVEAFLAATRRGDFNALLELLDPDVVLRVDAGSRAGRPVVFHSAHTLTKQARAFARVAPFCRLALVDGSPGVVMAPRGRLLRAVKFTFAENRITQMDVIADPSRLSRIELSVLGEESAVPPS
jgi:RNA polymerase sigma-70 factor (ECF subfamily)